MIKQAILITAYKNFAHLIDIINYFSTSKFEIYIHIDKKIKISRKELDTIKADHVKLISQKYIVNWGGVNHLKCILFLVEAALKNKDIKYFHLITGQDFPIKNIRYFESLLKHNSIHDYIEYFEMPKKWMNRIILYNFYDLWNYKNKKKIILQLISFQKKLNISRSIPNNIPKLYGGSTYWSLTRDTLQYVIDYNKNNKFFINRLNHTFCAEEIFFQTIILNSPFSSNVINDNLRYMDWKSGRGGYPAVIDKSDFTNFKNSNKLFARKFDYPSSSELKEMIITCKNNEEILKEVKNQPIK